MNEAEGGTDVKRQEAALRIGQAAARLGVSAHHLRQLCRFGLLEAEQSPGGQWRVPLSEIERLEKEGVPAAPTFIDEESAPEENDVTESSGPVPTRDESANRRLAPPSPAVIGAFEAAEVEQANAVKEEATVKRKENTVRTLRLEVEEQEVHDQLDAHKARRIERAAIQHEAARLAEEKGRHDAWIDEWSERALRSLPYGVPGSFQLELHDAVANRLRNVPRTQSDSLTRRLVEAERDRILAPWKRQRAVDEALTSVIERLPYQLRQHPDYADRKNQATQAARKAIILLGDVPVSQMEAAATTAFRPLVAEFEHEQRCARMASAILPGLSADEQARARERIAEALSGFPAGTSERRLEQARDEALLPFRKLLAKKEHEQLREGVLRWVPRQLQGIPNSDQAEAMTEIKAAVARLPVGTSRYDMEKVSDRIVERVKNEHEKHCRVTALAERGVLEVHSYVCRLLAKGRLELENGETAYGLAEDLRQAVQETLADELEGDETVEQVNNIVRQIVREELGI
jgi:excisionase family DNA binding protein